MRFRWDARCFFCNGWLAVNPGYGKVQPDGGVMNIYCRNCEDFTPLRYDYLSIVVQK